MRRLPTLAASSSLSENSARTAPSVAHSVRGGALARHGDVKRVAVKIDAKQIARYRELMGLLENGERDEALGFDRYWEAGCS